MYKLQVGFSRVDITPEVYGPMGGHGNDAHCQRQRQLQGVESLTGKVRPLLVQRIVHGVVQSTTGDQRHDGRHKEWGCGTR